MVAERIFISDVVAEYRGKDRKYYLITGVAWGLVIMFSLRAFQLGKVSTIVPIQAMSVLLNVIVAYLILKERDNLARKIIAACLVIVGIYLTIV